MCPPPTPLPRPMVTTMKNGREKEVARADLVMVADLVIVIRFYVTIAGRINEHKQVKFKYFSTVC